MQLHSSKYFAHRPPMPLSPSIGQKSTISEHGHVAYQIEWNHKMQQHSSKYFAHRPPPPHAADKCQLFQNMVMLHIKLKRIIENAATWYQIFVRRPPYHPPRPPTLGIGSKGQNSTFSEHGIKAYQIQGKHSMQQHSS